MDTLRWMGWRLTRRDLRRRMHSRSKLVVCRSADRSRNLRSPWSEATSATVGCLGEHRRLPEVSRKVDRDPARAAVVRYGRSEISQGNERYRGKNWARSLLALEEGNSPGPFAGISVAR